MFFEFLTEEYGVNDNNYKEMLRGIDGIAITKSIEFYVNKYNISFQSTIDLYISAIKEYFKFLNNDLNIRNDNFDSDFKRRIITESVLEKIKELKLEKTDVKSPITGDAFDKLLIHCDEILNSYTLDYMLEKRGQPKNNPITLFTSAIITKLVMLTGIKNQVLDTIKLRDYDEKLNIITVNNYSIHLPNGLGKQMKLYLELRNSIVINKDKDYQLLIKKDGTSIGTSYAYAFKIINDTIGNSSGECVAKYTIMQMIKKGMNFSLIMKLTKFGADSIFHCQEEVNLEKINEDIYSQTRYIDSKIRSMDIFDSL